MKRKLCMLCLIFGALLGFSRPALLFSPGDSFDLDPPIPPSLGRKAESKAMSYLSPATRTFASWLRRGKRYLQRKEFEQAIWAFRKAQIQRPINAEVHFFLGFTFEKRGLEGLPGDQTSWDQLAEEEYRQAISLQDYLPARHNLARLLERSDRYDLARREWEHILLISPSGRIAKVAKDALHRNIDADMLPKTLSRKFAQE